VSLRRVTRRRVTRVSLQEEKHREKAQVFAQAARCALKNCGYFESESRIEMAMEFLTRAKG
jgi:hypothetical protein